MIQFMKIKLLLILLLFAGATNAQFKANAGADQSICISDTLKVVGSGLSAGDTGTYQWKDLTSNSVLSNTSVMKLKIISSTTRNFELIVTKKTYQGTFISKDSFTLTVNSLPTFKYNGVAARCFDDGCLNLTAANTAVALPGNISGLRYFQKNKKPSWITSSSPYIYCSKLSNNQVPLTGLRDTICYEYRDNNGCYNSECRQIRNYPNPVVNIKNGIFCQQNGGVNLGNLVDTPFIKTGGIESYRVLSVPAGSGVDPNTIISQNNSVVPTIYILDIGSKNDYKKQGNYTVEYCFKNPSTGCQKCDTALIKVVNTPKIVLAALPSDCINNGLTNLDSFVKDSFTGKHIIGGYWECVAYGASRDKQNSQVKNAIDNAVWQNKYFKPSTGSGQYLLKYTNTSVGCIITDSTSIAVNGLPQIKVFRPDTVCAHTGLHHLQSNYLSNDPNVKWKGKYVSGSYYNSDSVFLGNNYAVTEKMVIKYTNPLTKCSDTTFTYRTCIVKPQFKFNYTLQANTKYLVDFNITDTNMNVSNFKWLWYYGNGDTVSQKYPKGIYYKDSGTYKVFLTIDNGICKVIDSITFRLNKVMSGIHTIRQLVNLYPNPTSGELTIQTPVTGVLNLFNLEGKLLISEKVVANQINTLNLVNLSEGIYFIAIENEGYQYWAKVVKTK